eukprot:Selendium_serpulae@DN6451_c1_g2_i2.p1
MADRIDAEMGDMPDIEDEMAAIAVRIGSHGRPLHYAAFAGHTKIVECLINSGANVGALTSKNNTALHCAAMGGHSDTVNYLVDRAQADVNARNIDGETPLHLAASGGRLDIVTHLGDLHVDAENNDGPTNTSTPEA